MQQNKIQIEIEHNESYAQKVYGQLKRKILSGAIPSGAVLNERDLSEQLSISRTPIRDALQMLETEGWLTSERRKRTVRMFTRSELEDITKIRKPLELLGLELAEQRAAKEPLDLSGVRAAIEDMRAVSDGGKGCYSELFRTDINVHIAIMELCGNTELINLYREYSERLMRVFFICPSDRTEYLPEHQKLVDMLERNDFATLREMETKTIDAWTEKTLRLLENYSEYE